MGLDELAGVHKSSSTYTPPARSAVYLHGFVYVKPVARPALVPLLTPRISGGEAVFRASEPPITILEADAPTLASALQRALDRELRVAVYTEDMFVTTNDDDNRAAVKAFPRDQ